MLILGQTTIQAIAQTKRPQTFCNPLDLAYRFQLDSPSRREAADPTLVRFKGEYWLFASKSGGYWHSCDLTHWEFIKPTGLPLEDYAPTVAVINGRMIFTAFNTPAIYSTDDPLKGVWNKVADLKGYPDPALFVDDDGRVYLYFGCSSNGGIQVVELDPQHEFQVVRGPLTCLSADYAHHGWEVAGDENRGSPVKMAACKSPRGSKAHG
ncbi:MAG: family 43 glycosylhydrolase [Limisphaerales bacterium]